MCSRMWTSKYTRIIYADSFLLSLLFPPFFSDSDNAACCTNDPTDLLSRIDQQHGVHTIDWAEKIGLGTKKYRIVDIDTK